jgi:hypothetical protein
MEIVLHKSFLKYDILSLLSLYEFFLSSHQSIPITMKIAMAMKFTPLRISADVSVTVVVVLTTHVMVSASAVFVLLHELTQFDESSRYNPVAQVKHYVADLSHVAQELSHFLQTLLSE